MTWLLLILRALLHEVAPWRHSWAETSHGPLVWTCRTCGAVERELPG